MFPKISVRRKRNGRLSCRIKQRKIFDSMPVKKYSYQQITWGNIDHSVRVNSLKNVLFRTMQHLEKTQIWPTVLVLFCLICAELCEPAMSSVSYNCPPAAPCRICTQLIFPLLSLCSSASPSWTPAYWDILSKVFWSLFTFLTWLGLAIMSIMFYNSNSKNSSWKKIMCGLKCLPVLNTGMF